MQPGAIPLQYVKLNAERHIPQIFNGNSIRDPSDLEALYQQTAVVGFSSIEKTPFEESVDDTTEEQLGDEYSSEIDTSRRGEGGIPYWEDNGLY